MQYLTFQLFTAGPGFDTEAGLWRTIQRLQPHAAAIAHRAVDIVEAIGTTGTGERKLGIVVGPLCIDHTDDQLRDIIDHGFEVAAAHNLAIGFHVDDAKFWFRRSDLWNQPDNVETSDWQGTLNTGQYLNWGEAWKLTPQACFNAADMVQEARRLAGVIGGRIYARLGGQRDLDAFAGIFAGWETAIGPDYETGKALGYRALTNLGFSREGPPASMSQEIETIVRDWIDVWAGGLVEAGIPRDRVYSHVMPTIAPIRSAVIANGLPGFSTYPGTGILEQIKEAIEDQPDLGWAVAEGANVNINRVPPVQGKAGMAAYLEAQFGAGAVIVNLFGWGVGSPANVFRRAVESPDAVADCRRWLEAG